MTPEERENALERLEATRRAYHEALESLTPEQWSFRPAPDRWSIAECAEHLATAEVSLQKLLAAARPRAGPTAESRPTDASVRNIIRDRSRKAEAPERVRPKGRFPGRDETLAVFAERRGANIAFLRATQDSLRELCFPHPFAGEIDGYQWVISLYTHVERHLEQIQEILKDPGFPRA
jgi:hypothetical protein